MILVDNSLFSRNGDILPTRWDSQVEAINLLATTKLNENLESSVGLMIMGGRNPEILVTPIQENATISATINKIKIWGELNFTKSIDIASLALKHRSNKNQRQRMITMVASPMKETEAELKNLAKKLRRNNISIDIINLGEPGNKEKLESFIATAQNDDGCTLVNLDAGLNLLTDVLCTTAVMGEGYGQQGETGYDADAMDAELQMVLRMSAEEARRQEEEANKPKEPKEDLPVIQEVVEGETKMDEEQNSVENEAKALNMENTDSVQKKDEEKLNTEEETLLKEAQKLSLNDKENAPGMKEEIQLVQDPDFIKDILGDLDIDENDEMVKELLKQNFGEMLDGEWKFNGNNGGVEWECTLSLKGDGSYVYGEAVNGVLRNESGSYQVFGSVVECTPLLPDTVIGVRFESGAVKVMTKYD